MAATGNRGDGFRGQNEDFNCFGKKSGPELQGEIVTLSLKSKGVRIVPEVNRTSENAASHRVHVGRAEIGAAWSKRSNEGRD
jgi:uncharacterized protein (DUF736 family)